MFDVKPITSKIEVDCGATCLQMLLAYYGIDVALQTLIDECGTNAVGCSAGGIKKAGDKYGLNIKAYSMSSEELIRQDRPAIIHWKGNHFCVFCGVNEEGKVVICNPDRGRFGLPVKSFERFYCGVSLWNGEPHDLPKVPNTVERISELEKQNEILTECILELSELLYN